MSPFDSTRSAVRWLGLAAGPLLAAACLYLLPEAYREQADVLTQFDFRGRATLAVMAWMACWWLTEAVDLAVTALLPLVLFPLLGVAGIRDAAAPYANPLIFLFMGGFLLALSMQRWGLDRRIALVTLRIVGTAPARMIAGFMLASALLSMFVSNTATAAMMLPIGLSVIDLVRRSGGPTTAGATGDNFATCLLLGIAYAASIGGIGTIIGTPPNAFLISFMRDAIDEPYRMEVGFARWMSIGLPLVLIFLPIVWLLLTRVLFPIRICRIEGGAALIRRQLANLGAPTRGEKATLVVFVLTASCWILRPLLQRIEWTTDGGVLRPLGGLSDAGIAMTAALLLFMIPVDTKRHEFAMDWKAAKGLPWGILLLFGGGLSLAAMVQAHGVAGFIGSRVVALPAMPPTLLVLAVTTIVIFLTELTSNTATTATLLPILAGLAPGLGVHPYLLIVPAAMAASCAFMMPVATPPNAIMYGTGQVSLRQMCRAGLWLNLIGALLVTLLTSILVGPLTTPPG